MKNWGNLTKEERAEYMQFQMSRRFSWRDSRLPDDSSYCGCCGEPTISSGWCSGCSSRFTELIRKLEV